MDTVDKRILSIVSTLSTVSIVSMFASEPVDAAPDGHLRNVPVAMRTGPHAATHDSLAECRKTRARGTFRRDMPIVGPTPQSLRRGQLLV